MPLFTPLNDFDANNSNQAVKELDMCNINNEEFDAIEHTTATFTKSLDSVPKE